MAFYTGVGAGFDDAVWDRKETEWTGKTFYFVPVTFLFGKPLGLGKKLEELNRQMRQGGYKPVNSLVLLQFGKFKGRAMVEVPKKDTYEANLHSYDIPTTVTTLVYKGDPVGIARGFDKLKELVYSRRSMAAREFYYLYVPNTTAGNYRTVLFAIT
jgi:hypothetical protein